ncbi:hypothetical protein T4B_6148 [Trichinella pseudospiralis]|uniref:Uncharacterized protein n=1 Tax=Trichinella pseudospiralis TaxID=6337 RepID=A0A0V1J2I9_TRIPS|nr:hypothetical protein T4A_6646 [Trichinella pseudospiralis]KRZ29163.1 hypothetical protein T4B_6148 [Trichinella pseudospiralis]KRZ40441.1 hypothetical protein T4C_4276 [Trichinella pseudospiralis]
MDEVPQGLEFCCIYIDDVLVAHPINEDHEKQYSVNLNLENFSFHLMDVRFIRFRVCSESIKPCDNRQRFMKFNMMFIDVSSRELLRYWHRWKD